MIGQIVVGIFLFLGGLFSLYMAGKYAAGYKEVRKGKDQAIANLLAALIYLTVLLPILFLF